MVIVPTITNNISLHHPHYSGAMVSEPFSVGFIPWTHAFDHFPKGGAVVHVEDMGDFVGAHIVGHLRGR